MRYAISAVLLYWSRLKILNEDQVQIVPLSTPLLENRGIDTETLHQLKQTRMVHLLRRTSFSNGR